MTDLVENLRLLAAYKHSDQSIGAEAADEIERLRAMVAEMREAMIATRAYCVEHSQAQFDANVKLLRVLDASTAAIAKADEVRPMPLPEPPKEPVT